MNFTVRVLPSILFSIGSVLSSNNTTPQTIRAPNRVLVHIICLFFITEFPGTNHVKLVHFIRNINSRTHEIGAVKNLQFGNFVVGLLSEMKRLLKYLLLSLFALAFYDDAREVTPYDLGIYSDGLQNEQTFLTSRLSSPLSDICIPRQVSSVNSVRVQNTARRQDNFQRQHFECIKAGKVLNSSTRFVIQSISLFSYSSLSEPNRFLTRLCRLII